MCLIDSLPNEWMRFGHVSAGWELPELGRRSVWAPAFWETNPEYQFEMRFDITIYE